MKKLFLKNEKKVTKRHQVRSKTHYMYTQMYKYQKDWELTPFSFLRGAAFAGGSLKLFFERLKST